VIDASTGAFVRATIRVSPPGRVVSTDDSGRFVVRNLPVGAVAVRAAALRFRPADSLVRIVADSERVLTIMLSQIPTTLAPVRTTATAPEREQFESPASPSVSSLSARDLASIPFLGEPDALRAAALLPGIASRNDFWAGFNVRGGESDQTHISLDGLPLFSPFHLGGLFSTFISDAVRSVDARAGALPASYGGRLSGAIDVVSSEESRRGVHGKMNASLLSSSAALGGALPKALGSWNVAVRRTYADVVANTLVKPDAFPYHFQDAQARVALLLPTGGSLALTGYAGLDLFHPTGDGSFSSGESSSSDIRFSWGNQLLGLTLTQPLGSRSELVQQVSYSGFATRFGAVPDGVKLENSIDQLQLAGNLTHRVGNHALRVGYELSRLRTRYEERVPTDISGDFPDDVVGEDTLFEQRIDPASAFAEDLWSIGSRLTIRPGVRFERVGSAMWQGLSPRLALKYTPSANLALTLAGGRYAQWVHAVRNEDLPIRIVDVWLGSDQRIPVSRATEIVGGAELWVTHDDFVRVESYLKKFAELTEPSSSIDPRLRPSALRQFDGRSYGVDVFIKHVATQRMSGWLSYSYGVSVRSRGGERYFPAHDRRHDANVVVSYRPGDRYVFAARLGVASGTPYTGWAGKYSRWGYDPLGNQWLPPFEDEELRTDRNSERYPLYHRIDLSLQRHFRRGRTDIEPYISVVNVVNHRNVFLYAFEEDGDPPRIRGFSQLPILPTFGLRVAF
jgi:hypothetical protein